MSDGVRQQCSAEATAEILNLHFDPGQPKVVLFERIMRVILNAMYKADEELNAERFKPSEN